jgi:hypothetical protein
VDGDKPALLLDASGPVLEVALRYDQSRLVTRQREGGAVEHLADLVQEVLRDEGCQLADLGGFGCGIGPGSILGIRVSLMLVQGWRLLISGGPPLRVWTTFDLVDGAIERPATVLAPLRGDAWIARSYPESGPLEPDCIQGPDTLIRGRCYLLPGRRKHPPIPPAAVVLQPRLAGLGAKFARLPAVDAPQPFRVEEPAFARWTPRSGQRGGAP